MGFNARYRMWNRENWQGYAPTIHAMQRRGWSLTLAAPDIWKLVMSWDFHEATEIYIRHSINERPI